MGEEVTRPLPRIVDLSLTLRHGMRGVEFESRSTFAGKGWATRLLHLYSHAGTHVDAPYHFIEHGRTLEHVLLEKCVGRAWVIDLSFIQPRDLITVEHLAPHADRVTSGARLLLRTDWYQHADLPDYRTHFPRVSLPLAEWLAGRGIALLGIEAPAVASIEDREELVSVHRALLSAEIVIAEGLAYLDSLRQQQVTFIALPLKIEGGDGSPVRAIAIEDDV
jgi:arylformamidase